jgi:YHS domain-containing protein
VRLAILVLWIAVLVFALLHAFRRRSLPTSPAPMPMTSDELVKDPVCGTYVVRSRAVSRASADVPPYFCSTDCARRFGG